MFGPSALRSTGTAALGGAAAGVGVAFVDAGRSKLVAAVPFLGFLDGVWGRIASAAVTALVAGGFLRGRSALAAAGASGAMGMEIARVLVEHFNPAGGMIAVGLQGSLSQQAGVGAFLDRLERQERVDRRLQGSLTQPPPRGGNGVAGSLTQSRGLNGTVYGGAPVSNLRAGARGGKW